MEKRRGVRDEALVLLLSVDNQQNWRHRKEEDVNLNFVFNIERIRSFGTRMGGSMRQEKRGGVAAPRWWEG